MQEWQKLKRALVPLVEEYGILPVVMYLGVAVSDLKQDREGSIVAETIPKKRRQLLEQLEELAIADVELIRCCDSMDRLIAGKRSDPHNMLRKQA